MPGKPAGSKLRKLGSSVASAVLKPVAPALTFVASVLMTNGAAADRTAVPETELNPADCEILVSTAALWAPKRRLRKFELASRSGSRGSTACACGGAKRLGAVAIDE